jgi:hypothetical protein
MTPQEREILRSASYESMTKQKELATTKANSAFTALKTKYGTNDKNSKIYANLTGATRTNFDTDFAAYEALKKTALDWTKTSTGYTTSYADSSIAGTALEEQLLKKLPGWVQKAVSLIDAREDLYMKDYPVFKAAQEKYYDAKDEMKIGDNWSWKQIEDYQPFMTKYGNVYREYRAIHKKMQDKNDATDLARANLIKAGYSYDNLGWAFKSSSTAGQFENLTPRPFTPSRSTYYYSSGGLVASRFAQKGSSLGTDIVPAMLTPGEFVMSKFAVKSHGPEKMKAINNGQSVGDSVYNYSISVNVKSESNPDEIARTVIAQIKSVDAQKMRGVRT